MAARPVPDQTGPIARSSSMPNTNAKNSHPPGNSPTPEADAVPELPSTTRCGETGALAQCLRQSFERERGRRVAAEPLRADESLPASCSQPCSALEAPGSVG